MSKFLGLRTTIYKVKEIEKARDWYAEVFETQPYFDQPYNETYNWKLKNGAEPHVTPENVGGDIEVATVVDPWGNVVGLIYNPSFKLVNSND